MRTHVRTYRHVRARACAHVPLMLQAHKAPGLVLPAFTGLRPPWRRSKLIGLIYTLLQGATGQGHHVAALKEPEAVALVDYEQAV